MSRMFAAARIAAHFEEQFHLARLRTKRRRGTLDPLKILPYRSYGNADVLYIKGRVLEVRGITNNTDDHTAWENLRDMVRRFTSLHVPRARVRVTFQGVTCETETNRNGFFDVCLHPESSLDRSRLWHDVALNLIEPLAEGQTNCEATSQIVVPPLDAEFGIISDIDDTIIHTSATDMLKMLRIVFLNNAQTRLPFEGVSAFYHGLRQGSGGNAHNPLFYVSSSAWNVYDLFEEFLAIHDIPEGPLLLREFTIDEENFIDLGHQSYKLERIRPLFEMYPGLPFVLIGDSGQEDPEIYREVVREYPGRVPAIYIRDVAPPERDREVHAIAEEVSSLGTEMVLVRDSIEAARHAAERGLVLPEVVGRVKEAKAEGDLTPELREELRSEEVTG